MTTIDELIDQGITTAREVLIGKPGAGLMPGWLIYANGQASFIGTPFNDNLTQDMVAVAIRRILKERNADAYSFLSDAWVEHQGVEMVMVTAFNRAGEGRMQAWKMKRDDAGVVTALVPYGDATELDGYDNLFKDPSIDTMSEARRSHDPTR